MRVLILAENYPSIKNKAVLAYIHTRNKQYIKFGLDVLVLNFSTKESYTYEGINVVSYRDYIKSKETFEKVISHAPNLKNHFRFLKKFQSRFKKIFLFLHGHEILVRRDEYPKPYFYTNKAGWFSKKINYVYDKFKLRIWRNFLPKVQSKLELIFVSEWMKNKFVQYVLPLNNYSYHVIYNSIGKMFEENSFRKDIKKTYNFITIRPNLDGSKYAVDLVIKMARYNPDFSFLIIGKGNIFKYFDKPSNVVHIEKRLNHEEIIDYLNKSDVALMPSRTDSQGVMACEMLAYGIPLVTSKIYVFEEIFKNEKNVVYIDNEATNIDLHKIYKKLSNSDVIKSTKFNEEITILKEVQLIKGGQQQ